MGKYSISEMSAGKGWERHTTQYLCKWIHHFCYFSVTMCTGLWGELAST